MLAFAHYSAERDISGVTTWLTDLMLFLRQKGEDVSINLHHFGSEPEKASLLTPLQNTGIRVSIEKKPLWTEDAVRDNFSFLNHCRPSLFLPQCLPAHLFAARLAANQGLPYILTLHSDDPEYWALLDTCAPLPKRGAVVAVSKAIASVVYERNPHADVHVIPYGVIGRCMCFSIF